MIGGTLRYDLLAQKHKPADTEALCREVRRLSTTGLSARDIAVALRLDLSAVREMLIATPVEAAEACAEAWKR